MRRAEGTSVYQRRITGEKPADAVDFGHFQSFGQGEHWHYGGQRAGQHGLAISEGTSVYQRRITGEKPADAVDFGHFQSFGQGEHWHYGGQRAGQHGLA